MKLKQTDNQEIIIGAKKEQSFSVDDSNPVIFDILRNKMYSNKIGAICREVSSNSRDANREAGRGDIPIEIEFTATNNIYNIGDTCIIFRDFGIGISPDRMENVFLKYAASTKRTSNAQTGGFGLGAKTPFAYTDSFIIKTTCDVDGERWQYTYNAIIDRTGKGKMITLDEVLSEDPTGTEIIVPIVTTNDRSEFEKECYRATAYWENVNYINFIRQKPDVEPIYSGNGFTIVNNNSDMFGYNVPYIGLIDGIPYPVKPSSHPNGLGSDFHILIDIDLDKITINANRESIQDDEETTEYLNGIVENIENFFKKLVDDYRTNHTDYMDALLKYHKIFGKNNSWEVELTDLEKVIEACRQGYSSRLLSNHEFHIMYDDEKVNGRFGLKYHTIVKVSKGDIEKDENDKFIKCNFTYKTLDTIGKHLLNGKLFYMDAARYATNKNLKLLQEDKFFLVIKPVKDMEQDKLDEDIDRLFNLGIEYDNYSEVVPDKKKIEYTKNKTKEVKIPSREAGYSDYPEPLKYSYVEGKLMRYSKIIEKDEVLFIPMSSVRNASGYSYTPDGYMLPVLEALGKTDGKKIYIVNESTFNRHLKPNGYHSVRDIYNKMSKQYLHKLREYEAIRDVFNNTIPDFLIDNFMEILPKSTSDLIDLRTELSRMRIKAARRLQYVNWSRLEIEQSKFDYDGFRKAYKAKMKKKYPMLLPYLNSFSSSVLSIENKDTETYKTVKQVINNYLKCL
ncbi:MAG: ATP-binding protein [Sphaerochaetaceae bacterium]|nr:ATP-binding protein [Sphaerochaetaceae bacterium]